MPRCRSCRPRSELPGIALTQSCGTFIGLVIWQWQFSSVIFLSLARVVVLYKVGNFRSEVLYFFAWRKRKRGKKRKKNVWLSFSKEDRFLSRLP